MNVAAKRALEEIENRSRRTQDKSLIMSRIAHVSTGLDCVILQSLMFLSVSMQKPKFIAVKMYCFSVSAFLQKNNCYGYVYAIEHSWPAGGGGGGGGVPGAGGSEAAQAA
jgi:hypothetical protein